MSHFCLVNAVNSIIIYTSRQKQKEASKDLTTLTKHWKLSKAWNFCVASGSGFLSGWRALGRAKHGESGEACGSLLWDVGSCWSPAAGGSAQGSSCKTPCGSRTPRPQRRKMDAIQMQQCMGPPQEERQANRRAHDEPPFLWVLMACFEPQAVCISSEAHDIPWSSCFERLCFEHSLRHPSLNSKKNWPFDPDKSKQSAANLPPLHWLHFDFPIPDCGKLFHYDGDQQPFPQSWDSFLLFLELVFVSELFHSFCYTVVASALTSLANTFKNLCTFIHCIHTCMFLLFLCFMPRQLLQVKNTNPSHEKGWEWVYSNLHIISQKHCQKIYINNKIALTVQLHCMKQRWKTEQTKKTLEILWAVCPSPTCGFPCSTPTAGLSKLPCCKAATPWM